MLKKYRIVHCYTVLGEYYLVEKRILLFFWIDCGKQFETKERAVDYIEESIRGEV